MKTIPPTIPWRLGGIYYIRNVNNGKVYVGGSAKLRKRLLTHMRQLRSGTHHSQGLQEEFNRFGVAAFEFRLLLIASPKDLRFFEQRLIDAYDSANAERGYNRSPTAGSQLGLKLLPESIERFRQVSMGRTHSAEARANMSRAQTGHPVSAETKAKISAARKGRKFGPLSEETKAKLSAAKRGKKRGPLSAETRARMSAGQKASPRTAAHLERLHQAHVGTQISQAHAAKLRAGNASYWAHRKELNDGNNDRAIQGGDEGSPNR